MERFTGEGDAVRIADDAECGLAGAGWARDAGKVRPGESPGGCAAAWTDLGKYQEPERIWQNIHPGDPGSAAECRREVDRDPSVDRGATGDRRPEDSDGTPVISVWPAVEGVRVEGWAVPASVVKCIAVDKMTPEAAARKWAEG